MGRERLEASAYDTLLWHESGETPLGSGCAVLAKQYKARENALMSRFVFFNPNAPFDARELNAAKKIAKANGAAVVHATVGSMLLEGSPEDMERVAASLPGWHYEPEHHYRLQERRSPKR